MNILILAPQPFFQNRGTPIAVRLLVQVLEKQGNQIHLLVYHEGEAIDLPNIRISRIPALPGMNNIRPGFSLKKLVCDLAMLFKCMQILNRGCFDIIHAVEESVFIALLCKIIFCIPYVYDMDSSLSDQMLEKFRSIKIILPILQLAEKIAIKNSSGVLPVCKALEDKAYKYDSKAVIQRLEDISMLPALDEVNIEEKKKIPIDGPIIMYIGNLEKYQGIDLLIDSFSLASKKVPDANLVIIGGDRTDITYYKNLSAKLNIAEKILFTGPRPVSDLNIYLAQADILVSPRIKGFNTPMKIYSYLDSGKPILATRLPTHTQVLDDNIAYLSEPSVNSMATGMVKLLKDKKFCYRLSRQGKQRIKEQYSIKAYEQKLLQFYNIVGRQHTHKRLKQKEKI